MNLTNKLSSNMSIYNIPGQGGELMGECESPRNDIEHQFVEQLAQVVCEVMDVNHNERRIVKSLLIRSMKNTVADRSDRRPGLLQQYLAHELEGIAGRLKRDLQIPTEVKVNHDYSTESKFSDIIQYIRENWVRIEDINSDGTFERIFEKDCGTVEDCCDEQCESAG